MISMATLARWIRRLLFASSIVCGMALLLSLLVLRLPSLKPPSWETQRRACTQNTQAIAKGIGDFVGQHSGLLPTSLEQLAREGYVSQETLQCPAWQHAARDGVENHERTRESYIYLGRGRPSQEFDADMPLVIECPGHHPLGIINVIYGDLHVDWLSGEQARQLLEQVQKQMNPSEEPQGQ